MLSRVYDRYTDALSRAWAKVDKKATRTIRIFANNEVTILFDRGTRTQPPYVVVSVRNNQAIFDWLLEYCKSHRKVTTCRLTPRRKGGTIYC